MALTPKDQSNQSILHICIHNGFVCLYFNFFVYHAHTILLVARHMRTFYTSATKYLFDNSMLITVLILGRHGRHRMVVRFTTTHAISVYHH